MKAWKALFLLSILIPSGEIAAEVELDGQFVQGGLILGRTMPGARVRLDERELKVGEDGRFVFGFSWDAKSSAQIEIALPSGATERRRLPIQSRKYPVEVIEGLPPRTVTIPEEERKRRANERAMVGKARALTSDRRDWANGFHRPAEGRVSGVYGSHRILNGKPRSPHFGLDIAGPVSTPIVAPAGGVVTLAEEDFLLEGGIVIIDHGFGVSSTLFHMQTVEVEVGQQVKTGQRIGSIGATGRASGPHVDWRVNWLDVRLDPQLLIDSGE